ncbi:MAG TPA: right-handed parallel beta-helix repeat-containing protein [Pirellulaceae bacterium]|nr:right-handed parallel beta-helix repeat-containing protein [Pirellulaceae bacterium]
MSPQARRSFEVAGPGSRTHRHRTQNARTLAVEHLEERQVLSTFLVTNTADSGAGSLRQAILDANANPGADAIVFQIPVSDPNFVDVDSHLPGGDPDPDAFVIRPLSGLPALTDTSGGTTIDGRSQTAFSGDTNPFGPEIVLDGSLARTPSQAQGLLFLRDVDNNAVFGLNIRNFSGRGINFQESDGNWVAGNYLGTDATGTQAAPNRLGGMTILKGSFNLIGTNADGVDDAAEGNLISGNLGSGVRISGFAIGAPPAPATQNVIAGNLIGTDATGTFSIGNQVLGLDFNQAHGNRIGTNGDGVRDAAERNVLSGNRLDGVRLLRSDDNVVAGNYIGTDATGTVRVEGVHSTQRGVSIDNQASSNRIGTNADGLADEAERNIISANFQYGVVLFSVGTERNVIAGNSIGVNVDGDPLGNGLEGIFMLAGASDNVVGTNGDKVRDEVEGNTIAFNARAGVGLGSSASDATVARNSIRGNSIHSNAGLGIDLGRDGVTLNDNGDGDTGPNELQNFPLLYDAVSVAPVGTAVAGTLRSTPSSSFTIDFYASSAADPSGFGEGERWLGAIEVTSNPAGVANFADVLPASTIGGEVLTATATDAAGNTSEFSLAITITPASTQVTGDAALALALAAMDDMISSDWGTSEEERELLLIDALSSDAVQIPLGSEAIISVLAEDLWEGADSEMPVDVLELGLAILADDLLDENVG